MAIVITHVTGNSSAVDAASYTVGAFPMTLGELYIAAVYNYKATTPDTPVFSAHGETWTAVRGQTYGSGSNSTIFFCEAAASHAAATGTITFGGIVQTGCGWKIAKVTGHKAGFGGLAALGDTDTQTATALTAVGATTLSLSSPDSAVFVSLAHLVNELTTHDPDFTELHDVNASGPPRGEMTMWAINVPLADGSTFGSTSQYCQLTVEIKPEGVGISPTGFTEEAIGTPLVLSAGLVTPAGFTEEAIGTPSFSFGILTVSPTGVSSQEAIGVPSFGSGILTISPVGVASQEQVGVPIIYDAPIPPIGPAPPQTAYGKWPLAPMWEQPVIDAD